MTNTTFDHATAAAKALGAEVGKSAASWAFDGNTSDDTYRAFIAGFDEGDPLVMDQFAPTSGWLSGEWADSETVSTLIARIGFVSESADGENVAEICDAYETAAEDAYWSELQRVAHLQTD